MIKKFTAELWDGSEYMITGPNGPIGNKISNRKSAQDIADWLNLNLDSLKNLEKELPKVQKRNILDIYRD